MDNVAIIDTHLHLWDRGRLRYPWLENAGHLSNNHSLEALHSATEGLPIEQIVFLECACDPAQRSEEVNFIKELAGQEKRIQSIVPFVPIENGVETDEELERLTDDPMITGIRRILQSEEDSAYCLRPGFVEGVQLLGKFDLHFEVCVNYRQMKSATQLIQKCPDTRFILDHIGKPDIKAQMREPWMQDIEEMAKLPNVWCKVSGMMTEAGQGTITEDDLRPYLDQVLNCFGFKRVMYGSDWPVLTLAGTYKDWLAMLQSLTQGCSEAEKERLFSKNARNFYRLPCTSKNS